MRYGASVGQGLGDVISYPGKVWRGDAFVMDPTTGHVSDDAIAWGLGTAGLASPGAVRTTPEMLASRSARIYSPPVKEVRPFSADYPPEKWPDGSLPASGERLTHDIDGRPLDPKSVVVGRRVVGGDDQALTTAELKSVTEGALGAGPQSTPPGTLPRGSVGVYRVVPGPDGVERTVYVSSRLDPTAAERVSRHETGHAIDDIVGSYVGPNQNRAIQPGPGTSRELATVYDDLNNPSRGGGRPFTPSANGYSDAQVPAEHMAEAIRAYTSDPNYLKTVAPNTAAAIRAAVNEHPTLSKVIQFNALPLVLGGGTLAVGGSVEARAAPGKEGAMTNAWPDDEVVQPVRPPTSASAWDNGDEVVSPAPGAQGDASAAVGRGLISGVPVVGPAMLSGVERGAAAVRAWKDGTSYDDALKAVRGFSSTTATEHPYATIGGEIAGGAAGTAPLIAAAPAAFGMGAGGLAARVIASASTGGALGAADSAVRSDGTPMEVLKSAGVGAGLGLAAPIVGAGVGAGVRAADSALAARGIQVPGLGNRAATAVAEDVRNSGGLPAVQDRLSQLGPDAMLLDAAPSLEGRAQGLAVLPQTRDAVMAPLTERARGANARLTGDVNATLGPAMDPATFNTALDAHYAREVPPLYRGALSQPVTVNTAPVLATIGQMAEQEKGGAANALGRAWGLLHTEAEVPGVGRAMIPDRRPEALHNAKEALDAMIATVQNQQGSAAASELRALSAVRRGVNDALEAQVPGYAEANRTAQSIFQEREAFNRGQTLLNGGREAARPAQVAAETAAMSPEHQQAQRLGLRAEVDRLVGTQLNDRVALQKALMGEGDYNRARMTTVFGDEPAARLAGAVDRERVFDSAKTRIVDNAMTELRKRAADATVPREIKPSGTGNSFLAGLLGGMKGAAGAAAMKGGKMAVNAVGRASDISRNQELARVLTMSAGPEREATLEALGRVLAIQGRSSADAIRTQALAQALLMPQGERAQRALFSR